METALESFDFLNCADIDEDEEEEKADEQQQEDRRQEEEHKEEEEEQKEDEEEKHDGQNAEKPNQMDEEDIDSGGRSVLWF